MSAPTYDESNRKSGGETTTPKPPFSPWRVGTAAVFAGLLIGWALRRPISETTFAWRRTGPRAAARRAVIAAAIATPIAIYVNWTAIAEALTHWRTHVPAILAGFVALQVLIGVACALASMPHRWTLLLNGELPAGQEAATKQAGWSAAFADARWRVKVLHGWPFTCASLRSRLTPLPLLGTRIDSDHRRRIIRVVDRLAQAPRAWFTRKWVTMPQLMPRALVLAESGHGKTVALTSMVVGALTQGARVVMIDCKGSRDDADALRAHAHALGKRVVCWPEQPLDLWRGDANAVVSIVKAVLPAHAYWQALGESVLVAVSQQSGPWRTTAELFERLRNPAAHVRDRKTLALVTQRVSAGQPAHMAIYQMVFAKLAAISHLIDGGDGSVALDDEGVDLIILSADCGADTTLATAIAVFAADMNAYRIGRRTEGDRPMLIVIDEVQVLLALPQPPDLCWLAEQCRGQGIGLVLATQSHAALGDSAGRLLGAGMDLWLGRIADPSALVGHGGTRLTVEMGWQKNTGRFTSIATARTQHTFRVDPNCLRTLPMWAWCVVSGGLIGYAYVPPVILVYPALGPKRLDT